MNPTLKCYDCGRALCGLVTISGKLLCADCISRCLSSRDAEIAEKAKRIAYLKSQRDAMQRRAETAESDWQNAETEITTLKETNLNNVACFEQQIADLKVKLAQAEARENQCRAALTLLEMETGSAALAPNTQTARATLRAALSDPPAGEKKE